jgi:hypothetical protein
MEVKMSNYDSAQALIVSFSGQRNTIGIPRAFCGFMGSLEGGAFLSQLIFWCDKGKRTDGFIYKTYQEWQDDVMLSEYKVKKFSQQLVDMGILETALKRANGAPTIHYRFDYEKFQNQFLKFLRMDSIKTSESLTDLTTDLTTDIDETAKNAVSSRPDTAPAQDDFESILDDMETVKASTKEDALLFNKINETRKAKGQRAGRMEFESLPQKEKWRNTVHLAELKYNGMHQDELELLINRAMVKGLISRDKIINYVAGCFKGVNATGEVLKAFDAR